MGRVDLPHPLNRAPPPLLPALTAKCGYNQVDHLNPPPHILLQEIARYTEPGRIQKWEGGGIKKTKKRKKAYENS